MPLFPSRHDAGKMKLCKSEHRKLIVTEAFVVVETAEQAVDRLAELHERATGCTEFRALKRVSQGPRRA
jgi:AMP nucleosidase